MRGADRRLLAAVAAVATATLVVGVHTTDLWPPDEPRVAEIAREMVADGDWLVPRFNGRPFLEEPPLFYWWQAAVYRVAGAPSAPAARLPAALAAVLGVLVTVALARAVGASAGIAALVLATSPEYWWMARTGTPDSANAAATALALTLFFLAWRSGALRTITAAAVAAGIAFWLKSFLGIGLAAIAAAAFVATTGWGRLGARQAAAAAVVAGSVVAVWLVVLWRAVGRGGFWFFVLANHLGRLSGINAQGHVHGAFYYLPNLILDLLPWSLALPAAVVAAWRARRDPGGRFLLCWAAVMTLGLSAAVTKRAHYLLPAFPAFAVLVARWWDSERDRRFDRATRRLVAVTLAVATPLLVLALLSLRPEALAAHAAENAPRWALALEVFAVPTTPGAWAPVLLVAVLAATLAASPWLRRPVAAAVAVGTLCVVLDLVVTLSVLPRFDRGTSARPIGEALARVAEDGVPLVMYGFPDREAIAPLLFYARRRIPEVRRVRRLERILFTRRVCAVVGANAWVRLPHELHRLPSTPVHASRRRFVLVSGVRGGCPEGRDIARVRERREEHLHSPSRVAIGRPCGLFVASSSPSSWPPSRAPWERSPCSRTRRSSTAAGDPRSSPRSASGSPARPTTRSSARTHSRTAAR